MYKDEIKRIFWDYLHTVTFAHDDQPNEPQKQVIFKSEIPKIVGRILKVIEKELGTIVDIEDCAILGYSWADIKQIVKFAESNDFKK